MKATPLPIQFQPEMQFKVRPRRICGMTVIDPVAVLNLQLKLPVRKAP